MRGSARFPRAPRRATRPLALVMLLGCLALTGCMSVQRSLTLNGDGSGVYDLTIGVRYPTPGDPTSIPANNAAALATFGADVQRQGGSYQTYDANGSRYWRYTRPFTSIAAADSLLQADPRQDDPTHFAVLFHDMLHVAVEHGVFGATSYHVTGTISLVDVTGNAAQTWRDASETLTITMANGLRGHRGGAQNGSSVTYTIGYNQSATVDVTGTGDPASPALSVLLAALAVVLAGVGVAVLRAARKAR
ncbi:MAG TPA: hypothetical protein VGR57_12750 [Ktedonobacterales bacterium]|nr:hypothetical protein [Ktedonobacterales bacterium]